MRFCSKFKHSCSYFRLHAHLFLPSSSVKTYYIIYIYIYTRLFYFLGYSIIGVVAGSLIPVNSGSVRMSCSGNIFES